MLKLSLILIVLLFSYQLRAQEGCTNPVACNYSSLNVIDNGSCLFPGDACEFNGPTHDHTAYSPDCVCTHYNQSDFNYDSYITTIDLTGFLIVFGTEVAYPNDHGDFNASGDITAADLSIFLAVFGQHIP